MPITDEAQSWLHQAGFRNYCFISYPHTGEPELDECAEKLRDHIVRELMYQGVTANVFIAKKDIPPGAQWPDDLRINLCNSVAMIAILMRAYLQREWCGIEWAAMEALGRARLPGTPIKPIIPVKFRQTSLPPSVAVLQEVDISQQVNHGKRYYATNHFRQQANRIVAQIGDIAGLIHANRCVADVEGFLLPTTSAFASLQVPAQPPPGRSE